MSEFLYHIAESGHMVAFYYIKLWMKNSFLEYRDLKHMSLFQIEKMHSTSFASVLGCINH